MRLALDLFAGAGGATAGLKAAGFRIVAAFENDPSSIRSYVSNHPEVWVFPFDLAHLNPSVVMAMLGLRSGEVDLLTACPPCQGFSTLGNKTEEDSRNDLVRTAWEFARVFRPSAVLMENVPGLRKDYRFTLLRKRLRAIGYGVRHYIEDAADFGVPQRRRRLILLAVKGISSSLLPDELSTQSSRPPSSRKTVEEAFSELAVERVGQDALNVYRNLREVTLKRIKSIPVGGDRFDLPSELQLKCHAKMTARQAVAAYGRMKLNKPAPTLTTRCTTPACGSFIHPTEDRGISLREAATLQTFPADYVFKGSYGSVERQIGNAVPVKMLAGVGAVVKSLLREASNG